MMVKIPVGVPSISETVVDDESISNVSSSQCRPAILKPERHGKPSSFEKVSFMNQLLSQYSSTKNECETNRHQSGGSVPDPSHQDSVEEDHKLGVTNDATTSPIRDGAGTELMTRVDAALALMELASDSWVLIDELDNGNHSHGTGYKAKICNKFRQSPDEDGCSLHKKKRKVQSDCSLLQSKYMSRDVDEEMLEDHELITELRIKGQQHVEARPKKYFGCDRVTKKQKRTKKKDVKHTGRLVEYFKSRKFNDEPPISSFKKRRLKKLKIDSGSSDGLIVDDALPETKPLKEVKFTSASPTVRKGFSFSIIHFLSAIRTAMITLASEAEDAASAFGKHSGKGSNNIVHTKRNNLPFLTINEIVERVRENPGDPCVLEAKEPLEDLVRGALNIFSSKIGPLGVNGWRALTSYLKSRKSWSWIGPVSVKPDESSIKDQISAEAWGLPRRMLMKLVDSFANWLRSVQETLQRIGSLPAPPMTSMQTTENLEERLRGVRSRRCIPTIAPCSAEVRNYFHKEEALRYSVPERAFSYTAVDGRKSTVAPLRRCSGKPQSKVRDHVMLKANRPPHVTVLCLVRDAAARLPASMGTRSDVCILVRDSQYITEDVSDEALNRVVSRALDRLHYENDPCVQYNGDRKIWVYLHGERAEDEFDDDGTLNIRRL